uniref:Uncharacterized protein n=2 Tax=Physcomitrium patens TaxID=3218 RepID=A0A2K1IDL6_PHYPA|nr:hypothetical protein PHYPA_029523 [Physcomitrium patens]
MIHLGMRLLFTGACRGHEAKVQISLREIEVINILHLDSGVNVRLRA